MSMSVSFARTSVCDRARADRSCTVYWVSRSQALCFAWSDQRVVSDRSEKLLHYPAAAQQLIKGMVGSRSRARGF